MRLPYICPEMENNKIHEFVIKDRTNIYQSSIMLFSFW